MLDALMAATEKVVITYTGADERTGARRPPAVPLGELLDALDDTATDGDRRAGHGRQILVPASVAAVRRPHRHARRRSAGPAPFTFDPAALGGARAAAGPRHPVPLFLPSPLPAAAAAGHRPGGR